MTERDGGVTEGVVSVSLSVGGLWVQGGFWVRKKKKKKDIEGTYETKLTTAETPASGCSLCRRHICHKITCNLSLPGWDGHNCSSRIYWH